MKTPSGSRWLPVGAIALLVISLRFWPLMFGRTLFFGDNYSLLVPGRIYTATWLQRGVFPLWNPEILGGISWAGEINEAVLYPTTWLFMWFNPATAVNLTVLAHVLITFLGMYYFVHGWVKNRWAALTAAVLWAFSTQFTGSINNLATLQSLAWLPWVVLTGQAVDQSRRARMWFPVTVALQLAGGYPQHVLFGIALAGGFSLLNRQSNWRSWGLNWVKAGLTAIGLSAWLLWPFTQTIAQSTRTVQTADQALAGSLHPLMALKLLLPYIFDMPVLGVKWGPAWNGQPNSLLYVTWFGLMVLGWGWRQKGNRNRFNLIVAGVVGVTLLLAFGKYLPGYDWAYLKVPLLKWGRYPSMILLVTNFLVCLLIGRLLPSVKISGKSVFRSLVLAGAGLLMATLFYLVLQTSPRAAWNWLNSLTGQRLAASAFHTPPRDILILKIITGNFCLNSLLVMGTLWAFRRGRYVWVTGLIAADMALNTTGMLFYAPDSVYAETTATNTGFGQMLATLKSPQVRFLTRNMNTPYTDFGMYWEALTVRAPLSDSFIDAQEMRTYRSLRQLKDGLTPDWNITAGVPILNGYTTLLPLSLAESFQDRPETRINFLGQLNPEDDRVKRWAVAYYLIDKQFLIREDLSRLPLVYEDQHFAVRKVPDALARFRLTTGQPVTITRYQETPNKVVAEVVVPQAGTMVMADRYDRDWQATLDGQTVPIRECQQMRCVEIPANTHTVIFEYRPRLFYLGLLTAVGTLLGLLWGYKFHHPKHAMPKLTP